MTYKDLLIFEVVSMKVYVTGKLVKRQALLIVL